MKYRFLAILTAVLSTTFTTSMAQTAASSAPLRVAIAGMVHGHVEGFLQHSLHRPDIQVVGFSEADQQVAAGQRTQQRRSRHEDAGFPIWAAAPVQANEGPRVVEDRCTGGPRL